MPRATARQAPVAFGAAVLVALLLGSPPTPAAAQDTRMSGGDNLIVSFDIKPTSCPNPFNPTSPQFLIETFPTAILGDDSTAANNIRESSLLLTVPGGGGGLLADTTYIAPIHVSYEDVATPLLDPEYCECHTEGPDGVLDLAIKFSSDELADALGYVWGGQEIQLCIIGELLDGTPFRGCDCIWIVGPVPVDEPSWGKAKAQYR